MLSNTLRNAFLLRSTFSRSKTAASRLPATSAFLAYRLLSTSRPVHSKRFVYLGNLPWRLEPEDIKEVAEKYGSLQSITLPDDESGRPSGFANVEFVESEDAKSFFEAAVDSQLSFEGRRTRIELLDFPQEKAIRREAYSAPAEKAPKTPSNTLFIGGISYQATEEDLSSVFGEYGEVVRIKIATDNYGNSRGFAHIEFKAVEEAEAAFNSLQGTTILNRRVGLDYAADKAKAKTEAPPSKTIYFNRYPGTEDELRDLLKDYADSIERLQMLPNQNGIIEFSSIEEATAVREAFDRSTSPEGYTLNFLFSTPRDKRPRRGER